MTSPLIPIGFRNKPSFEEQKADLETKILLNIQSHNSTCTIYKKSFYAKRVAELSNEYKLLTGNYFDAEKARGKV